MKLNCLGSLAVVLLAAVVPAAADVFIETFGAGSAVVVVNDPYRASGFPSDSYIYYFDGSGEVYVSPTFPVDPNTGYQVIFDLLDRNGIDDPVIEPEIDGTVLGSPVGTSESGAWQQFSFLWDSGSNTSASIVWHDFPQNNVNVAVVPEPQAFGLLAFMIVAIAARIRRH